MVHSSPSPWNVVPSWLGGIGTNASLGDVWLNQEAQTAFDRKEIKSVDHGGNLRVCFRNHTPNPLILCWVSHDSTLNHFYELEPCTEDDDMVTENDRIEQTFFGHAFVFGDLTDDEDLQQQKKNRKLDCILAGFRSKPIARHGFLRSSAKVAEKHVEVVPIVTIRDAESSSSSLRSIGDCCLPTSDRKLIELDVKRGTLDQTPLDTSKKVFKETTLAGWPVRLEPGCFDDDPELKQLFEAGLRYVRSKLPPHACDQLSKTTPIYINKSCTYGPVASPVRGRGMCFHPESGWLKRMGMTTDKCECVEVYKASDYRDDCKLWGTGGVLLHELSHAYHWKLCKDGYENAEIKRCWKRAMDQKLYESVRVHGSKGKRKAYACENCMEYFAELSAAFLGGLDDSEEYNKWYPFNRNQIREHDPRAYEMLKKMWKVDDAAR